MPDDKLARALGSKVRRDILNLLLNKKLSVHLIAKELKLTEVNASKHLKKLYDLGLLDTKTLGRERFYSLRVPEVRKLLIAYAKVAEKI